METQQSAWVSKAQGLHKWFLVQGPADFAPSISLSALSTSGSWPEPTGGSQTQLSIFQSHVLLSVSLEELMGLRPDGLPLLCSVTLVTSNCIMPAWCPTERTVHTSPMLLREQVFCAFLAWPPALQVNLLSTQTYTASLSLPSQALDWISLALSVRDSPSKQAQPTCETKFMFNYTSSNNRNTSQVSGSVPSILLLWV